MLTFLRKKMKVIMIVVAFIFAASMFYGIGYTGSRGLSSDKKEVFLKVNGKEVDPMRFNNMFAKLRQNFSEQLKPSDLLFLQNLAMSQTIDFSIILDEARKKQRVPGSELDAALEALAKQQKLSSVQELRSALERSKIPWGKFKKMIRDEIIVQKMMEEIRNSVAVSQNDLREIKASHILITIKPGPDSEKKAREQAFSIKSRIDKGEDFAKLAKVHSEDPGSKDKGGDLGFFSLGRMVKPFEDLAFNLKVNEIGGPVKSDFGYHIIKVTDARLRTISGVKDIEQAIAKEKQDRAFQDRFYKLKQKAKVEILDHNLKAIDYRFKGKITEAIAEYKKAIAESPENAYYHLFLGLLYEDIKNIDQAIAEYKEAVLRAPIEPNMYIILGKAYLKNNQRELALEQFKKVRLIAGDNKALHLELEKTFKELKLPGLAAAERSELQRIEKKEAFEKSLQEKGNKIKTE